MYNAPKIVVISGTLKGTEYYIQPGGVRLGRSSLCEIHIPDENLSRNHCLFETYGESGLNVTDLASINGTFVNGDIIDADPHSLSNGDIIEVGSVVLEVVLPTEREVDLGLGSAEASSSSNAHGGEDGQARSARRSILILGASVLCVGLIVYFFGQKFINNTITSTSSAVAIAPVEEQTPVVREVFYEKVEADQKRIFRYEMTFSADNVLTVSIDDVPDENRHPVKNNLLGSEAVEELNEILSWKNLKDLDPEYIGVTPDPPALASWSLKVVYSTCVKNIRVVNVHEPEAFRAVRERLEAFTMSELGVWAIQYPRSKLLEMAEKSYELGNSKWFDREVEYGNLSEAVAAYKETLFYLETIDPKPPLAAKAREGMEKANALLSERCKEQRFLADRAINLARWNEAKRELMILLEMVPDRRDDRHRDAKAKLLTVENQIKRGGRR